MKKIIIAVLMMIFTLGVTAFAQTVVEKKDKVHRTSTLGQKVHNVFHKKKHYNGYKVKHKKVVEKVHK
jgi:hypothetical protein